MFAAVVFGCLVCCCGVFWVCWVCWVFVFWVVFLVCLLFWVLFGVGFGCFVVDLWMFCGCWRSSGILADYDG